MSKFHGFLEISEIMCSCTLIAHRYTCTGADPGISKRGGGARSRRGGILRSKVCFDASLNIPYVFVRRVVNNIHILNTACWLKSKYLRIYNEKLPKKVPFFFSNGRARARRAGPGSAFDVCPIGLQHYTPSFIAKFQTLPNMLGKESQKFYLIFFFTQN